MKNWYLPALAVFVLLLRLPYFNNPAVHIDEQFYLVVADKWLNSGAIPFVDIWDRKPIGIFVLYALPILLFKNAILGYQLLAAAFVIATGDVIIRIGRLLSDARLGFMAALVYAVATMLMEGPGGQTPIFYNLFVAIAAFLYLRFAAGNAPLRVGAVYPRCAFGQPVVRRGHSNQNMSVL